MTRSQERRARRQVEVTRQALAGFEQAIAEHPSEPRPGVHPEAHRLVLAGMVSMRDDLRGQLGRLEAVVMGRDHGPSRKGGVRGMAVNDDVVALVRLVQATPCGPGECVMHLIRSGRPRRAAEAAFRHAVDVGLLVADRYTIMHAGAGERGA